MQSRQSTQGRSDERIAAAGSKPLRRLARGGIKRSRLAGDRGSLAKRITKRAGTTPPIYVPTLSEHIRGAIAQSGLSVYYIARKTDVDQSTLNKFLNRSRRNIRLDVADRLYAWFFHPPRQKARPFK